MPARSALPIHILLVEKQTASRALVTERLTAAGYRVTATPSAVEAVARLAQGTFDLVLSDGFPRPLARPRDQRADVRAAAGTIPVILLSSWRWEPAAVKASGYAAHLTKPFDMDSFTAVVAHLTHAPRSDAAPRSTSPPAVSYGPPRSQELLPPQEQAERAPVSTSEERPPLIACFDSCEPLVDLLCDLIASEGWRAVPYVQSVPGAVHQSRAFLEQRRPDAVIFNVSVPYAESWAEYQSLRQAVPDVPFVVTTTHPSVFETFVGATPPHELVGKPFDIDVLLGAVRRVLVPPAPAH